MGLLMLSRRFYGRNRSIQFYQKRFLSGSNSKIDGGDSVLPVLIVGAGPVGLVLSILLTKLGVGCAVLEKNKAFSIHPQAHFINNRSMEVFRKINGLADEIMRSQPPVELWRKFIYCTSLTGPILGEVDHMQPQDFDRIVSPVSVAHFSQYKLTRLLSKQLESIGFRIGNEELSSNDVSLDGRKVLMGHECKSINPSGHGVTVTASFLEEGKYLEKNFQCDFLVGTDGAGSTVRKLMGIEMSGEKDLQKLISVHFMSRDLGQYLISERPGMLFFIFNTDAIGVLVAHDLLQGEFVLQMPFYPPQQKLEDFSFKMCERLIFKLVGRELADIEVMDIKPWIMHAEVAEKFASHNNRVILAGDAAHRFPPAGGFGMNTGIQDAHNLAWKLASVINGIAPPSILFTYEMERKQVSVVCDIIHTFTPMLVSRKCDRYSRVTCQIASFNTALSLENFKAATAVPAVLGLDPAMANAVHRTINNTVGSILPSELQKAFLEGIFSIGRAQLSDSLLNQNNPLGSRRLAKLRQIFEEGKSLQLQFPAEDLGFRYLKGAVVSDGDSSSSTLEKPTGRRRDYIPSTDPGSRLPHMNIRLLSELLNKELLSTLDLIPSDNIEFLLIIAPIEESYNLARSAFKMADELKVPLKVSVIWPEQSQQTNDGNDRSEEALSPWKNFVDAVEVKTSPSSSSWWDLCKMTDRGAILVRPDEHIAWRAKSGALGNLNAEIRKIFHAVLGL